MTESFGLAVVLYAVVLAGWFGAIAARGRPRGPASSRQLVALQAAVLVQAGLDLITLTRTDGVRLAVHLGYGLTSLAVLPVAAAAVRLDRGRWGSAALAVGCAVLAVVSIRLHQTLQPADG